MMKAIESQSAEQLTSQPEGTRFFLIRVRDPQTNLIVVGAFGVPPDEQEQTKILCNERQLDYDNILPHMAVVAILDRLWPDGWPEGYEVLFMAEMNREHLMPIVQRELSATNNDMLS